MRSLFVSPRFWAESNRTATAAQDDPRHGWHYTSTDIARMTLQLQLGMSHGTATTTKYLCSTLSPNCIRIPNIATCATNHDAINDSSSQGEDQQSHVVEKSGEDVDIFGA